MMPAEGEKEGGLQQGEGTVGNAVGGEDTLGKNDNVISLFLFSSGFTLAFYY